MMDPSKKRSFEDHWKKAFDEASIEPPASAWEGIEARLDQGDTNAVFEDQWKNTFEEAFVVPPVSVWEGIEARLDKDENGKIIPIWWHSPKLWYTAASIAALLVTGGLWLNNNKVNNGQGTDIASSTTKVAPSSVIVPDTASIAINRVEKGQDPSTDTRVADAGKAEEKRVIDHVTSEFNRPYRSKNLSSSQPENTAKDFRAGKNEFLAGSEKNKPTEKEGKPQETGAYAPEAVSIVKDQQASEANRLSIVVDKSSAEKVPVSIEMLAGLPYKDLDVYFQKRYVFYHQEEEKELPPVKKHQEYWAGVGLMPASFNPDVSLKTSPTSFATKSFASQKSLTGKNDPGFSYAVQTQGGMRVSKHWSVETGISYLQGNSQYEGGGYLLDPATYGSSNVLENALADVFYINKGMMPVNATGGVNNSIYIDVTKQVRNDYQYLQLPVQAGFTLNPDGKLSYSVLGGMMANFFLNNELESGNGNVIKTTASDDVYRSLNWAATTGLRFNYRLSSKWRATLTGSYQKAVTSGFRANQNLESHPSLYGVSWGMRYSF